MIKIVNFMLHAFYQNYFFSLIKIRKKENSSREPSKKQRDRERLTDGVSENDLQLPSMREE